MGMCWVCGGCVVGVVTECSLMKGERGREGGREMCGDELRAGRERGKRRGSSPATMEGGMQAGNI